MLDVLFALKRFSDIFVRFKIDKRSNAVTLREPVCQTFPMFLNAPDQIVRHAHVKRSTGLAGEDVNPITHLV